MQRNVYTHVLNILYVRIKYTFNANYTYAIRTIDAFCEQNILLFYARVWKKQGWIESREFHD